MTATAGATAGASASASTKAIFEDAARAGLGAAADARAVAAAGITAGAKEGAAVLVDASVGAGSAVWSGGGGHNYFSNQLLLAALFGCNVCSRLSLGGFELGPKRTGCSRGRPCRGRARACGDCCFWTRNHLFRGRESNVRPRCLKTSYRRHRLYRSCTFLVKRVVYLVFELVVFRKGFF